MSTPGPWEWEYFPDFEHPIVLSGGKSDVLMATSDVNDQVYIEVSESDAQLIARTPDLLSLVERALADRIDDAWLKDARNVLAKAEPPPLVVTPPPSFQPPDACPDCAAGVPFDSSGRHIKHR